MNLYPDQQELVNSVRNAMRKSKSVLMTSPTGSGKTAMATHMIQAAQNKKNQIIFTVPRKDLLEQTSETFFKNGIDHSYIAAGKIHNPYAPVFIGMIDTMARRLEKLPKAKLVIIDEARYGDTSMNSIVSHFKAKGSYLLGLDATPWKLSGKGLGCWYDTMVQGKSVEWLIENKRLSDYRYFGGRSKIDLSQIKVTAGDYAKGELASFMEHQGAIIGDCVRAYREQCMGRIHLVRCASIKHSQMTAESFRLAGIPAAHVDGTTPMDERKRIFKAFARREILVVCFCTMLEFGFDLSQYSGMDVCIESGSDLKPSKSLSSMCQWWGRLLRYKNYPAIINDHVNNFLEHEYPCTPREWTLEDREQGKRATGEKVTPVKQCVLCHFCSRPSPVCPNCGHVREVKSRELDEVEGALVEVDRKALKFEREKEAKDRMRRQQQARTLDELIAFAKAEGYKAPEFYASKIFTARKAKR